MTGFAVAAVFWQSAEQVCREVEATDAASVTRLVRVVLLLSQLLEHVVVALVLS